MNRKQLRDAIAQELQGNLLPFWRERSLDHHDEGFVAEMALDGAINRSAPKGLILHARLLWAFSSLYHELSDMQDLALARRAFLYLEQHFRDKENGGYVWRLGPDGPVADSSKKIYGQAFCIYALSEFHRATGEPLALQRAVELFQQIEQHARDTQYGGYIEVLAKDWSSAKDLRLSDKDMDVAKSMNTHLHLLEAYANLFRAWPDPAVSRQIYELIHLFGSKILMETGHFHLFFDADWTVRSDSYTYGHDIEGAWLLYDAAATLRDPELMELTSLWAETIAQEVYTEALDVEGGLAYEGRNGAVINPDREWWPQAEAILGFHCVYNNTGVRQFWDAATRLWQFIQKRMIDRANGEWFWRVLADGAVDQNAPKISEWKDPYHAVRMCLRMLRIS